MAKQPDFSSECFFITPIGGDGSVQRARADRVLQYIVRPAVAKVRPKRLKVVRADELSMPGSITDQVIEHCVHAVIAIADLTDLNANVFYELGIRHARNLPTVLISETRHLPFDIASMRTVFFDHQDLQSAAQCVEELARQLKWALEHGAGTSPVGRLATVDKLSKGTAQDRSIAAMLYGIDEMMNRMRALSFDFSRLGDRVEAAFDDEGFTTHGNETEILSWVSFALAMLGDDMRSVVAERLGVASGTPRSSEEIATDRGITAEEVDEMVRSALNVWASDAFHDSVRNVMHERARAIASLRREQER